MEKSRRMPVIFVGHGSPMNIIEKNKFTDEWRAMSASIPRPKAILCISAHWFEKGSSISAASAPETIYDFYGFPKELYKIDYPAPGAPELALKIANKLPDIKVDTDRGLDHGAWSVLNFMYPEADIPVCQLSVNSQNTTKENFEIGKLLRYLRDEGVLIMGSDDVVHNLSMVNWQMDGGYAWADEFDSYIKTSILSGNFDNVINYKNAGDIANYAFVYRDHFDPLLYVIGALYGNEDVKTFNDERVMGALSMTSYVFG